MTTRSRRAPGFVTAVLGVVVLLGATAPGARAAVPSVVKAPDTIVSDCSVDVTKALNAWFAGAANGSTLELAKDGCYRVDGSLFINDKKNLTLDGNGASFEARTIGDRDRRHVWINRGKNLVVRDLRVKGANPTPGPERGYNGAYPFQHGFALQGVNGIRLERVEVEDVFGDFVYIGGDFESGRWSRDVTITRSKLVDGGRQGISIVAGKHIVIDRNEIAGAGQSLLDLEANSDDGGAVDVRITRNRTGSARHFWLANKGAGLNIRDIVVKNNRMIAPTPGLVFVAGPSTGFRGPMVFADNRMTTTGTVFDSGSKGALFFSRAQDITIRDNVISLPAGRNMPAVENRYSLGIRLEGNTFLNAGEELLVTGVATPVTTTAPRPAATAPRPATTARP